MRAVGFSALLPWEGLFVKTYDFNIERRCAKNTTAGEVWSLKPADDLYSCSNALSGTLEKLGEWRGNSAGTKQLLTQQFLIAHAVIKRKHEIYTAVCFIDDRCCIRETSRRGCDTTIANFYRLHRAFWNLYSSLTNKCTIYWTWKSLKFTLKYKQNIAPTCFGLRSSSGSLYWVWLKLY
jgi:hypothetical protein